MSAWVAGTAIVVGSVVSSNAAKSAASTQAAAADRTAALQKEMFDLQMKGQEPFRQAGLTGQNRLMELLGLGGDTGAAGYGKYGRDFAMSDYQADPGYAFRLSEGQKALDRQAAARGGLISGGALKAATRYGQDMGSQEYMNAFNRYQTERAALLNPLQSLAGVGQTTASNLGSAGQSYGAGASEAYMGGANARASGYVGGANALTSGLGSYLNYSQGQDYLNRLRPPTPYGPPQTVTGYQG
jgi:hypothetical protein